MPTGLTANIYEGKDTSLRSFALDCVRQLGAGYRASNYGEDKLPMDKPPVLKPEDYYRTNLKQAEEKLAYWLKVKDDPAEMKRLYDAEQTKSEIDSVSYYARMKGVKERYETMITRVEQWQVTEEYASLKDLMLSQLRDSLKNDYCPQFKPYQSPSEPIEKWIECNISIARRDIDYYKEKIAKEEKSLAEINAYLKGLYDMLDEVEPYIYNKG